MTAESRRVDAFPGQVHDIPPGGAPRFWPRLVSTPAAPAAAPAGIGCDSAEFTEPCAGAVVFGDVLLFSEKVLGGTFDRPVLVGTRVVMGQVVGVSAGPDRPSRHIAIEVFSSHGAEPLEPGVVVRRKASEVSRWSTRRRPWDNEAQRQRLLAEAEDTLPQARKARLLPRRGLR